MKNLNRHMTYSISSPISFENEFGIEFGKTVNLRLSLRVTKQVGFPPNLGGLLIRTADEENNFMRKSKRAHQKYLFL